MTLVICRVYSTYIRQQFASNQLKNVAYYFANHAGEEDSNCPFAFFQLLSDCLTIVVAAKLGSKFTPEYQAALQKFLAVVVSALGRQYH